MKKVACVMIILTLSILLINPISIYGRVSSGGGQHGGGHSGGGYNWSGHHGWQTPWYFGGYSYPGSLNYYSPSYYSYPSYYAYPSYYGYYPPYYSYPYTYAYPYSYYSYPYAYAYPYSYYSYPSYALPPAVGVPRNNADPSSMPATEKHFIYPRLGQSEKQQADDQYQCNRWAVGQTGFDPTDISSRGADGRGSSNRLNEYWRAMGACLEGRGYTIK